MSSTTFDPEFCETIVKKAYHPDSTLVIKDRKFWFTMYKNCFSGQDFLKWIQNAKILTSTQEALQLASAMLENKTMIPFSPSEKSLSESGWYHFRNIRVTVIGGGCFGAPFAQDLIKKGHYDVTIISNHPEYHFTMSIPFMFNKTDGAWSKKLTDMFAKQKIIIGEVVAISDSTVEFKDGSKHDGWDYLAIATGSSYADISVKDDKILVVKGNDMRSVEKSLATTKDAKKIVVVGSGTVGCEIFAPLCEFNPDKKITMITSSKTVMERSKDTISKPVQDWIKSFSNGEIKFGQKVVEIEGGKVKTDSNEEIEADLVYLATGFVPNTSMFTKYFSEYLDVNRCVNVTDNLRLAKHPNIFVAGDIANLKEEKLGQSSKQHGEEIAVNIQNILAREPLKKYVKGMRGGMVYLGSSTSMSAGETQIWLGRAPTLLKYYAYWNIFSGM